MEKSKNKTTFHLKSGEKISFINHGDFEELRKILNNTRFKFLKVENYLFRVDSIECVECEKTVYQRELGMIK